MVAFELMEERLRRLTPPHMGTQRLLHGMLYSGRGSGTETELKALEITVSRMIEARKSSPIAAIRPRTFLDALETYRHLRERGGTMHFEQNGVPLRSVFHSSYYEGHSLTISKIAHGL